MININDAPSHKGNDKDNRFKAQLHIIYEYLKENTSSRYMAAIDTGISIQNVCWYVKELRKNGLVAVLKMDKCRISGEWVEMLTTDSSKFPVSPQLKLWQ